MKVALVHDWLTVVGGAERVLLEFHQLYPDAPIFTAAYDPDATLPEFKQADIRASFLQRALRGRESYAALVPLMPLAFSRFDTRSFDLLLVSSHTAAKGVQKHHRQRMVCYCHTPMRWAWDLYDFYMAHRARGAARRLAATITLRGFARWDRRSARKVDQFIANSENVRRRIQHAYGRDARVVWPPVDGARFVRSDTRDDYFLVVSRLEDHKRVDLAVDAFTQLGWPLRIVGDGPQRASLQDRAGPTVTFLGRLDDSGLAASYAHARALVFPADEDAGIVPLEAMASGLPVLALERGGAVEVVRAGTSGAFFAEPTVESLVTALRRFHPESYDPGVIRAGALRYDRPEFRAAIARVVDEVMAGPS